MKRRNFVVGTGLVALLSGAVYFGTRGCSAQKDYFEPESELVFEDVSSAGAKQWLIEENLKKETPSSQAANNFGGNIPKRQSSQPTTRFANEKIGYAVEGQGSVVESDEFFQGGSEIFGQFDMQGLDDDNKIINNNSTGSRESSGRIYGNSLVMRAPIGILDVAQELIEQNSPSEKETFGYANTQDLGEGNVRNTSPASRASSQSSYSTEDYSGKRGGPMFSWLGKIVSERESLFSEGNNADGNSRFAENGSASSQSSYLTPDGSASDAREGSVERERFLSGGGEVDGLGEEEEDDLLTGAVEKGDIMISENTLSGKIELGAGGENLNEAEMTLSGEQLLELFEKGGEELTSFIEATQKVIQPGIDPATGLAPENPVEIHDAWAGLADLGYGTYSTGPIDEKFTGCSQTLYDAVHFAWGIGLDRNKVIFESTLPDGRYDIIINAEGNGREILREKLREQFGIRGEVKTEEVPAYSVYADDSFLEILEDDFDGSDFESRPEWNETGQTGTRYVVNGTLDEIVGQLNGVFSTKIVGSGSYDDRNLYRLEFFCEGCKYGKADEAEIMSILKERGFGFKETTSEIERVRIYVDGADESGEYLEEELIAP